MHTPDERIIAGIRALYGAGDLETRQYCGSYVLIRRVADGELFRCADPIPDGYTPVEDSTDEAGYLLPWFWSLPRL